MFRCALSVFLLTLLAPNGWSQPASDKLLPRGAQLYFRFDGLDRHREEFRQTALGKMMRGDTGVFLAKLLPFLVKQIDLLREQAPPEVLALIRRVPETA